MTGSVVGFIDNVFEIDMSNYDYCKCVIDTATPPPPSGDSSLLFSVTKKRAKTDFGTSPTPAKKTRAEK